MNVSHSEADPNIELNGGGVVLLALAVFLPSVISFFFTQKKRAGPPLDLPLLLYKTLLG